MRRLRATQCEAVFSFDPAAQDGDSASTSSGVRRELGRANVQTKGSLVALGGIARGVFAVGGLAMGLLTLGGCSLGLLLAICGFAAGGVAIGGAAVGLIAIGGGACGSYACGGLAAGKHIINARSEDPKAVRFFTQWIPGMAEILQQRRLR